jgi:hypothetical protein
VVAVGLVLFAGAVTSTAMRRQRRAAELAVQQRKLMQQRAEELRAQKAVSVWGCCQVLSCAGMTVSAEQQLNPKPNT